MKKRMATYSSILGKSHGRRSLVVTVYRGAESRTQLGDHHYHYYWKTHITGRSASSAIASDSPNVPQNLMGDGFKRLPSWNHGWDSDLLWAGDRKKCTLPASQEPLMQLAWGPHSERIACIQGLSLHPEEGAQVLWLGVRGTSPTGS